MRARIHEFLRFCVVGFAGYLIDAVALELLVGAHVAPFIARVFSILIAMQATYVLHTRFTYRGHAGFTRRSWLRFMTTNGMGACINYGVFLLALYSLPLADALQQRQAALLCGTAVALGFNHWANRRFVFRGVPR